MGNNYFQTDLFTPVPEYILKPKSKAITYKDLNINQKINVKANNPGFAIVYLRQGLPYQHFSLRTDDIYENINWKKHDWDKDHNHGGKKSCRKTRSIKIQALTFHS